MIIIVREIIALLAGVKGELKDFHSREARILYQLADRRCDVAEILRNDMNIAELLLYLPEEAHAGALDPFAVLRGLLAVRDLVILIERAEMIDAEYITELKAAPDPADPPLVMCLFQIFPVIDRIAPELTVRGKCIRRASGDLRRHIFLVEEEHFRVRPGVRAVDSGVERNIPDDLHAFFIRIAVKLFPLLLELILLEGEELDHVEMLRGGFDQSIRISGAEIFVPLRPGLPAVCKLDCHIQAVIVQPVGVFLLEVLIFRIRILKEPVAGLLQHFEAVIIESAIIDSIDKRAEIVFPHLMYREQAVLDQQIRAYKVRISGEGRKTLVRRVAETGRSEGKHLPVALPRLDKEVDKIICLLRKASDPVL